METNEEAAGETDGKPTERHPAGQHPRGAQAFSSMVGLPCEEVRGVVPCRPRARQTLPPLRQVGWMPGLWDEQCRCFAGGLEPFVPHFGACRESLSGICLGNEHSRLRCFGVIGPRRLPHKASSRDPQTPTGQLCAVGCGGGCAVSCPWGLPVLRYAPA